MKVKFVEEEVPKGTWVLNKFNWIIYILGWVCFILFVYGVLQGLLEGGSESSIKDIQTQEEEACADYCMPFEKAFRYSYDSETKLCECFPKETNEVVSSKKFD